jgi:hypothetical protein
MGWVLEDDVGDEGWRDWILVSRPCVYHSNNKSLHLNVDFGGAVHLHCAGNDANYTLRALLALLEIETRDSDSALALEVLGRIAREDIPKAAPGLDERSESSSDEGLAGTFFDEHCDF